MRMSEELTNLPLLVAIWNQSLALDYNNTDIRAWTAYQNDLLLGGPDGLLGAISRDNLAAVLLPTQFSPR